MSHDVLEGSIGRPSFLSFRVSAHLPLACHQVTGLFLTHLGKSSWSTRDADEDTFTKSNHEKQVKLSSSGGLKIHDGSRCSQTDAFQRGCKWQQPLFTRLKDVRHKRHPVMGDDEMSRGHFCFYFTALKAEMLVCWRATVYIRSRVNINADRYAWKEIWTWGACLLSNGSGYSAIHSCCIRLR